MVPARGKKRSFIIARIYLVYSSLVDRQFVVQYSADGRIRFLLLTLVWACAYACASVRV
jgi:hypothetical protein